MPILLEASLSILSTLSGYDAAVLRFVNQNRITDSVPILVFITDTAYLVSFLIPFAILCVSKIYKKQNLLKISYQLFISLFTSTIIINVLKYTINRPRPFTTYRYIEKLSTGGSPSFPSGHTADAFVMAVSVTLVAGRQLTYVVPIWLWAITVAYSRIALGVHYPSDVIGSMFIGSVCALLGKWLLSKNAKNN